MAGFPPWRVLKTVLLHNQLRKENVMVCTPWTPRCQGSFGVFEMFSVSGKAIFYRWRQGHEEMVKRYGNSPESTAHSLVDPDIGLKKFFYVSLR